MWPNYLYKQYGVYAEYLPSFCESGVSVYAGQRGCLHDQPPVKTLGTESLMSFSDSIPHALSQLVAGKIRCALLLISNVNNISILSLNSILLLNYVLVYKFYIQIRFTIFYVNSSGRRYEENLSSTAFHQQA